MVHGILQFTPSIAFRYVLHRCESRDIRCRESFVSQKDVDTPRTGRRHPVQFQFPWRIPRPVRFWAAGTTRCPPGLGFAAVRPRPTTAGPVLKHVLGSLFDSGFDNDPSAGSPTETLLRLLLPLNDKVQWTSFDVAGS